MADRMSPEHTTEEHPNRQEPRGQGPALLEDVESLKRRATEAEQKRDEYLDLLKRSRADFENYQKRNQRSMAEERLYACAPFARELLPIVDNLMRALATARKRAEQDPLVQGVALVQAQLLDVFGRFGITTIDALGKPFDPNLHEAVAQQPRSDVAPGTVIEVLEPGYRLHERVLRPARVVVAAPAPTQK